MVITRTRARRTRDCKPAFRKFQELPKELRLMIWDAALPRYGKYTLGCEEEEEVHSPDASSSTLHLRRPRRELGYKLPDRIRTTRDLLMVCHESRTQAKEHSPDAVTCRKGEIRFNAEEDLIQLQHRGHLHFRCEPIALVEELRTPKIFTFANKWNLSIQRLSLDRAISTSILRMRPSSQGVEGSYWGVLAVKNYLELLKNFPSLKQLVLSAANHITIIGYNGMDASGRSRFRDDLGEVYSRDIARWEDTEWYDRPWLAFDLPLMTDTVAGVRAVIHVNPKKKVMQQVFWQLPHPLSGPSPRLLKLGDKALRHLEALGMTDINPELRHKGIICTETELE